MFDQDTLFFVAFCLVVVAALLITFVEFKIKYGAQKLIKFSEGEVKKRFYFYIISGLAVILIAYVIYDYLNPIYRIRIKYPADIQASLLFKEFIIIFGVFFAVAVFTARIRK